MHYDLFISYSRKDNLNNRVTELKERFEADYLDFAKEELHCFFDHDEIKGMDDWKHRILEGLKESDLLLLILSPHYLDSSYCEWEIVEYLKYEYARATQGEGIAQIYFMEIPGLDDLGFLSKAKAWLEKINPRQRFDFRPWYDEGIEALKRTDVKDRLDELKKSLHERITRMRRIAKVPGNLPAPNARFVGRVREMKSLHESVGLGKFGVISAVHGIGGLGKTTLAFQYAYAYADFYPGGRWYIGCANDTSLAASLKKLDIDLNVTFTEEEEKDDIRGAKRILKELETLAMKGAEALSREKNPPNPAVLLLLDNVDHAELIQPPNSNLISGKKWLKVLITTRIDLGTSDNSGQNIMTIDELPFNDAVSLIESYQPNERFINEDEKEKAGKIVKLLDGFTLAVEVAALYLSERKGRVSCGDFLEVLKNKGIDFAGEHTSIQLLHTKLISATLSPTLDTLHPEEMLILNYAALLPPDSIPLPWIKTLAIKEYPHLGAEEIAGLENSWISTINHLLGLRLLQIMDFEIDGQTPQLVRMHRLVQAYVGSINSKHKEKLLSELICYVKARSDFFWDNWVNKEMRWEINPISSCALHWMQKKIKDSAHIANKIHWALRNLGFFSASKDLLEKAIEIYKQYYKSNHTIIAKGYSDLSILEQDMGNLNEAKKLLKKALLIDKQNYDPNHRKFADYYANLSSVEHDLGNIKEAKKLLKKALEIDKINFDPNDPHLSEYYCNLALIEQDLGNFQEARVLLKKTIAIDKINFDLTHPTFGINYHNLASIEQDLGNIEEAKKLFKKAIKIDKKNFEPNHPTLATDYYSLALVEQDLGNIEEAKKLLIKTIEIETKNYKPNHPTLAKNFSTLAIVEKELGNLITAKELIMKAIDINNQNYDANHPEFAKVFFNLAMIEKNSGNLKEAKKLLIKATEINKKNFDLNHPEIATDYYNLALVEYDLGNVEEAETLFRKALAIREKSLPDHHPGIKVIYDALADLLDKTFHHEEAKKLRFRS